MLANNKIRYNNKYKINNNNIYILIHNNNYISYFTIMFNKLRNLCLKSSIHNCSLNVNHSVPFIDTLLYHCICKLFFN